MSSIFDKLMGRIGVTREPVSRGGAQPKLFYPFVYHLSRKRYPFRIPSTDKWYPFHIPSLELGVPFRLVTSRPLISRPATEGVSRSICQVRSNGFELYYKFTREKNDKNMLCREPREISLTVLLVICHDVTGRIFDRWISRQTGMKSPLKWRNQPWKKKDF